MIVLDGVRKQFGGITAVDGVSFTVAQGQVFGLAGPSGAGKTTTLQILATLLSADEGSATVSGITVDSDPRAVRNLVGYVSERSGVYARQTAREYLEFYAGIRGVTRSSRRPLAAELLQVLGLVHRAGDEVCGLTKDEQRRLALGRALVHDPAVLLLDEPVAGLDTESAEEVRLLVAELVAMGKTIVISGHVPADLEGMCTTLGLLQGGRMVVTGPLAQVREEVASALLGHRSVPSVEVGEIADRQNQGGLAQPDLGVDEPARNQVEGAPESRDVTTSQQP